MTKVQKTREMKGPITLDFMGILAKDPILCGSCGHVVTRWSLWVMFGDKTLKALESRLPNGLWRKLLATPVKSSESSDEMLEGAFLSGEPTSQFVEVIFNSLRSESHSPGA